MKKLGTKVVAAMMTAVLAFLGLSIGTPTDARVAVAAENYKVEEKNMVLYSNGKSYVYQTPDINSAVLTTIAAGLPVGVTGVTSNGWFRISLGGTYYVPTNGLDDYSVTGGAVIGNADIQVFTQGTFSFFKNSALSGFDADDVEDMDENTYIKYMDSFLMGYAIVDNCILQDTGEMVKNAYAKEVQTNPAIASMTLQAYLINYRNRYFSNSMAGPHISKKSLKLALNRAIRYDIKNFICIYKNSSIGSNETKMKDFMDEVIDEIKAEQGVSFTCKAEYKNYKDRNGSEASGWVIEVTKKD